MKIITIEECDEGYLVKSVNPEKIYAVSKDRLIHKVKGLLEITDHYHQNKKKKIPAPERTEIDYIGNQVSKVLKANPEPFISPSAPFVFNECAKFDYSKLPGFKAGKTTYHIQNDSVQIEREGYKGVQAYATRNDLKYLNKHPEKVKKALTGLYENKKHIVQGFLHDVDISKIGCNEHLVKQDTKEAPKGQENGSCDDVAFESCANNTPKNCKFCIDQSRYEDKKKIAGQKPDAPLLKANMGI